MVPRSAAASGLRRLKLFLRGRRGGIKFSSTPLASSGSLDDDSDSSVDSSFQDAQQDSDDSPVLDELEQHFDERHELLRRIVSKNPNLRRQIELRERLVRYQTLQDAAADKADDNQRIRYQRDVVHQQLLLSQQSSRWYDSLVFEWHSGIMASISLFVHCWAYVGIDRVLDAALELASVGFWLLTIALSVLALRATGDLFWWLADDVASCVKHDRGNRALLNNEPKGMARLLEQHAVLRAILFIVGYSFCFGASVYLLDVVERNLFDDWHTIVESLPSKTYTAEYGFCPLQNAESFCAKACQDSLAAQGKTDKHIQALGRKNVMLWDTHTKLSYTIDELYATLQQMDLNHTWEQLPCDDYEEFWHGYLIAEEEVVVKTMDHHIMFWIVTTVGAVLLLRLLGCKFWFKY